MHSARAFVLPSPRKLPSIQSEHTGPVAAVFSDEAVCRQDHVAHEAARRVEARDALREATEPVPKRVLPDLQVRVLSDISQLSARSERAMFSSAMNTNTADPVSNVDASDTTA